MTTRVRAGLTSAVLMVALAGCAGTEATGGAVGSQPEPAIWDRTFIATGAAESGQAKRIADGTRIKLTFRDGNVQGHAGCNQMSGPATIEDGVLVVPELASTLMACEGALNEQDAWLTRLLESRPTVRLDGVDLVLATDSAQLRLTEDGDAAGGGATLALTGTRWLVESLVIGGVAATIPTGTDTGAQLTLDAGRVEASTGCRTLSGQADIGEGRITFTGVRHAKARCPGGLEKLDPAMIALLDGEVSYQQDSDQLVLTGSDGTALHLRAQP